MGLTQQYLQEALDYDPVTGVFTWRSDRPQNHFSTDVAMRRWRTRYGGTRAGALKVNQNGYRYRHISVGGKIVAEHKLAFLYMGLDIPKLVDHNNRDATDNRWCNLSSTDHRGNNRNMSMSSRNTSGVTGVYWCKPRKKWVANTQIDGKVVYLGGYSTRKEAEEVVVAFRREKGFHDDHGKNLSPWRK